MQWELQRAGHSPSSFLSLTENFIHSFFGIKQFAAKRYIFKSAVFSSPGNGSFAGMKKLHYFLFIVPPAVAVIMIIVCSRVCIVVGVMVTHESGFTKFNEGKYMFVQLASFGIVKYYKPGTGCLLLVIGCRLHCCLLCVFNQYPATFFGSCSVITEADPKRTRRDTEAGAKNCYLVTVNSAMMRGFTCRCV